MSIGRLVVPAGHDRRMTENTRSNQPDIQRRYVEEAIFAESAAALLDPAAADDDYSDDVCVCRPPFVARDDFGRVLYLSHAAMSLRREHEAIGLLHEVLRQQPDRMLGLQLVFLAHLYAVVGDVAGAGTILDLYLAPERARPPADRDLGTYSACASYAGSIIPGCREFALSTVAEAIALARDRCDDRTLDSLKSLARRIEQDGREPPKEVERTPVNPPGRNAPCWCGSRRKYKKCCGHPARRRTVMVSAQAA